MSCDRYVIAITDHALGAALPGAAAAHLRSCAACSARLEEHRRRMAAVDADLRAMLQIVPSADFHRKVHARIEIIGQADPRAAFPAWWMGAAAAAALVIAIVAGTRPGPRAPQQPPRPEGRSVSLPAERAVVRQPAPVTQRPRDPAPVPGVARWTAATTSGVPAAPATGEPEVLVPPDQGRAIARLIELVNQGVLADVDLANRARAARELVDLEPTPITVAPITIRDVIIDNSRSGRESGR